ncbi:hypothetical protein CSKR_111418 [Clonorchis sinensis]|uniref:UspA domain-containing protein n=1 Tax=Clonorchis sinensis TaxID=79923 RepID=A0A3R7FIF8_CLOSI|nr:hypothetical protein CSKR_111418 [Clonorchis sinensis]
MPIELAPEAVEALRRIVLPIDNSEHSKRAMDWYFANMQSENDFLLFVHVVEPTRNNSSLGVAIESAPSLLGTVLRVSEESIKEGKLICHEAMQKASANDVKGQAFLYVDTKPAAAILRAIAELKAHLLVKPDASVIYCCPASPPEDNQFLVQPPEQLSCSHHFKHLLLVELHRTIVQNTHDTEAIFVPRKPARSRMYPVVVSEFCRKHQVGLYSVTTTSSHTNLSRHNHEGPQTIVVFTENGNYQLLHKTNAFSAFGPGEIYSEKLHSQRRSVSALFFVIHSAKATSCDLLNGRATLCQCLASCPPSMRRSLLSEVDSLDVAVIMTLFVPCARCSIRRTVESIPNILESVSGLCVTVMVSFLPPQFLIFRIAWGNIYEPGTEHIRSERQPLNDKNKTDPGNLGEGLDPVYQSVKSIKIHSATRFLPNRSRVATMLVFMGNQARDMGLISDAIFFDFAKETQRTPLSCVVRMGQKTLQFGFVDLFKRPHCVKNFGSKDFRRSTYDSANIPLYYSHGLPDTLCGLCRTVS